MKLLISSIFFVEVALGRKAPTLHIPLLPLQEVQQQDNGRPDDSAGRVGAQPVRSITKALAEAGAQVLGREHPGTTKQELPHSQHDSSTKGERSRRIFSLLLAESAAQDAAVETADAVKQGAGDVPGSTQDDTTNATETSWADFLKSPWAAEIEKPQNRKSLLTMLGMPQDSNVPVIYEQGNIQSKPQVGGIVLTESPMSHSASAAMAMETSSQKGFSIAMETTSQKGFLSSRPHVTTKFELSDFGSHEVGGKVLTGSPRSDEKLSLQKGFSASMETTSQTGFLSSRPHVTTKQSESSDFGSHEVEMGVRALLYEFVLLFEILVGLIVYALIGTFAASFVARTFHCSWRTAMTVNIMWPVSMCVVVAAMLVQRLRRRTIKQPNLAFDCFSKANLKEAFGGDNLVTPERISERLDMPLEEASRWHGWFAGSKPELSLKTMLVKASELHTADGEKICGILFDVHSGGREGGFSMKGVADVLESWCIHRYGDMCKCGGEDELIQIIMGLIQNLEVSDSGNITQAEWMQLSSEFPELFEPKSPYPAHVSYLKVLCRVRKDACVHLEDPFFHDRKPL